MIDVARMVVSSQELVACDMHSTDLVGIARQRSTARLCAAVKRSRALATLLGLRRCAEQLRGAPIHAA
jgi:hypothetical protein